ncbi:MAG: 3'-5' exonuclease [Betaproteobacteria bacterium AqS2]|uniref:3'-5' exonuclease n=1 Tax=Candidatus Amphirhobacter heronislandensis TaxID=1732024 RepID=A0A930UEB0_9GAMM|nr:3'-5' exonuclease [Betaproteobacteria bacterium AqS2]
MSGLPERPVAAFDAETVPDAELLRLAHGQPDASDADIAALAKQKQLEKTDGRSDFLPLAFHQVVAVSIVLRGTDGAIQIVSKAAPADEKTIIEGFFAWIARSQPLLVSWNGKGFDLPMLALRALRHGVDASGYWRGPPGGKWDPKYVKRYDDGAHADIMDFLSHYNPRNAASLEHAALLCGLPGKMGYEGSQVEGLYRDGKFDAIRDYCELDALNTYLIWLRLQLSTGALDAAGRTEEFLAGGAPHLQDFLQKWRASRPAEPAAEEKGA